MNTKLKIAIVGAGIWGENHAEIYTEHPFAEVVGVCDHDLIKAETLSNKTKTAKAWNDYNIMLDECDCDAVAIVTPDFAHADIAVAAATAKKHILIEKPLATTRDDVYRIVDAVRKNNVRAMVDLHNRWSPPFNVAYQNVADGEIGVCQHAYMRLNDIKWVGTDMLPWAAQSSILWFLGCHSLDTLRWFFNDEVRRVYSVSKSGVMVELGVDAVDTYLTTVEFSRGGIAHMENSWITPNANPCLNDIKFNITGSKGMISLDVSNHNMIQKYTDNIVAVPDTIVKHSIFGRAKGFAYESIRSFVDCVLSGEEFKLTLEDAANTSLALLAVMESADTRMPVEVNCL